MQRLTRIGLIVLLLLPLTMATNAIVCRPDGPEEGYLVDRYHATWLPTVDLQTSLRAQGKSDREVQAAVSAALEAGTLQAVPSGATHVSTGLPTEPGDGTSWLMLAARGD